jgi:hypothetical protein
MINRAVNNNLRVFMGLCLSALCLAGCDPAPNALKDGDVVEVYHASGSNLYHFDDCQHWSPDMRAAPSTFGQLRRLWSERSDKAMPCPDCAQPRLRSADR